VTKRSILAATLALLAGGAGTATAGGWIANKYDMSLGQYYAAPSYSYNVAYGYSLPFGGYELYNPFDPFQNPGRGAYYPRESFYSLPPYGLERYTGPRYLFHNHDYADPPPSEVVIPALEPVPAVADGQAVTVEVSVPANAQVWFDGQKTAQSGTSRVFHSPSLKPGVAYMYLVRAKWPESRGEMEQVQTITVRAGERARIAFPVARP
jgi:uncharacterized protein (TIGR03000 family)